MNDQSTYPLVSVVIATYNGEMFLREQLDSVINQTYPAIEIIAVDDCSTDNTVNILNEYAGKYAHLKIFKSSINRGYIKNFERGMQIASGKFIALCDQDDTWDAAKLMLMVEAIDNYNMLYCDSEIVDGNLNSLGKKMSDMKNLATYSSCMVYATDNCTAGHASLITKKLYLLSVPFPEVIPHDWWLAYVATLYGGIKYLDKALVKYRHHGNNVIGAVHSHQPKKKKVSGHGKKQQARKNTLERLEIFYKKCPNSFAEEKKVMDNLIRSYKSFSIRNNYQRMKLFLDNRYYLLAIKKRPAFRKFLYCCKMFYKPR